MKLIRTGVFDAWLSAMLDAKTQAADLVRLQRLAAGNAGDAHSVGGGVTELRIHMVAGWRVYFTRRGDELVIPLCGGSKRRQVRDIARAKTMASKYEEESR